MIFVTLGAKISGIICENFNEDLLVLVGKYYNATTLEWVYLDFIFTSVWCHNEINVFFKHALPTLKFHKGILIVHLVALQCVFDTRVP